jgi:hypothetical protein
MEEGGDWCALILWDFDLVKNNRQGGGRFRAFTGD